MLNIPKNCPVCNSTLERVNDQLFCRDNNCSAKSGKKLLHFIKSVKIKGLGEKTLEKLDINFINELYLLTEEVLINKLGSEKLGSKLFKEIQNSRNTTLSSYIQAFGIPLIGNSASTKLAKYTDSLWDIDKEICKKAGLGNKATSNLLSWIDENKSQYKDLPINPTIEKKEEVEEKFSVCITGKLNDFSSRNKAKEFLESKGITVKSGVSSKVDYVICDNTKNSTSEKRANELNIPIITMNDLKNIL